MTCEDAVQTALPGRCCQGVPAQDAMYELLEDTKL